jgi:hypothetical protein
MLLGGVPVEDHVVRRLATILGRPVRNRLDQALAFRAQFVALTREEKRAILNALETAPPDLEPIRELLLADENWRLRDRL